MSLTEAFYLMKNGKAVRMIELSKISQRKEEELRLKLETVIVQTKNQLLRGRFWKSQLPKIVYVNPAYTS
jgi:hypothetical protein